MEKTIDRIQKIDDLSLLEELRIEILGRQGQLTLWMKELHSLDSETRKMRGQILNKFKNDFCIALAKKRCALETELQNQTLIQEKVDTTLPPWPSIAGKIHPLTQALSQILFIFRQMGFQIVEGPDIEDEFHNFTALNVPPNHPARSDQDTFYLPPFEQTRRLLRTHTSPVQIRTLMSHPPPLRIIVPGRVYRSDWDQTHTPMFHQVEGLVIEPGIHMGHLKGCLEQFCQLFFEQETIPLRIRPSFFPFTEPSAEVDIGSYRKEGQLKIGATDQTEWLEILGCGMVHPKVLTNCGLNPNSYQGFAFGLGLERVAILKYGIPDLRNFFENDQKWLDHYGFRADEVTG